MSTHETTLAHLLRGAGYATGMFGKYHTGHIPCQSPNKMGFDVFRGMEGGMDHHSRYNRWGEPVWYHDETLVENEEGYSTELIARHALQFIDDHRDRPFVLYVADWMVHFQFNKETGRFMYSYLIGFIQGKDDGSSTPTMEIGTCTALRTRYW